MCGAQASTLPRRNLFLKTSPWHAIRFVLYLRAGTHATLGVSRPKACSSVAWAWSESASDTPGERATLPHPHLLHSQPEWLLVVVVAQMPVMLIRELNG